MSTAILSNGDSYYIPQADLSFFKQLAERMKWKVVKREKTAVAESEYDRAMTLMDSMMAQGGSPVPADADGMDIIAKEKYVL